MWGWYMAAGFMVKDHSGEGNKEVCVELHAYIISQSGSIGHI